MSDTLLEKETVTTDTPPDKNRHYFKKEDMDRNLLDGVAITAICGFIKVGLACPSRYDSSYLSEVSVVVRERFIRLTQFS